jgi:hypothetical protein
VSSRQECVIADWVRLFVPDCKLCDRSNALAHESTCARSAAGQQEAAEQFATLETADLITAYLAKTSARPQVYTS